MRDRPFLYLARLEHRLSEGRAGKAVTALVRSNPDQTPIELDEAVFGRSAPPALIVIDLAFVRWDEVSDFLGRDRVGNIENANTGVEPGRREDFGLGYSRSEPALGVVRTEAA